MLKYLLTKAIPILTVIIILSGCEGVNRNLSLIDKRPELVYQAPLPAIPWNMRSNDFVLDTRLLLDESGSIKSVYLISSTNYPDWDSLVIRQLKKWKFTPAVYQGQGVMVWLRQPIKVSVTERFRYHIAEIVMSDYVKADSVYRRLLAGDNFDSIASLFSESKSQMNKGDLGVVDIRRYPLFIQEKICALVKDDFTLPIEYKHQYYIFRRSD